MHLTRGRLDLHAGKIDSAIKHLESVLQHRQWFGKIGTSQADMHAAAMISLSQALLRANNHLELRRYPTWTGWFESSAKAFSNRVRAWWHRRRALQILTKDLAHFEDLYIRNTDSLIEYPTLGEALRKMPARSLARRIDLEKETDNRKEASLYYKLYLAENTLAGWGGRRSGMRLLDEVLAEARPRFDDGLIQHARLTKLGLLDVRSQEYEQLAGAIFKAVRSELRNYGFRLPVNFHGESKSARGELGRSAFIPTNTRKLDYVVSHSFADGQHVLDFTSSVSTIPAFSAKAETIEDAVNQLADAVFTVELKTR